MQEQPLLSTHWLTCSSELLEQGRDVNKWSDLSPWNTTPETQENLSHLWFSIHLLNPFCFLMRCFTIKQTGGSSWWIILWWKPRMLIAFLPYFIWQICHQTPTWQERIPRGARHLVLPGVWGKTKPISNKRAGETKPLPDLHIPLILLKLRWIFDLPRCRSFLHIWGLIYQSPE